jgi:hypothetical protein
VYVEVEMGVGIVNLRPPEARWRNLFPGATKRLYEDFNSFWGLFRVIVVKKKKAPKIFF